jgi:hypothetical protein
MTKRDGLRRRGGPLAIVAIAFGCAPSPTADPTSAGPGDGGEADRLASGDDQVADGNASGGADDGSLEESSSDAILVLDRVRIGSLNGRGWPNIGRASAEFVVEKGPFAKVTLVIDLESACYPFEKWSNDPPPAGQVWPADCDAFDRNFNVFIDDTSSDGGNAPPPFEVVHAITPFGGPEHLEVDVTDFANGLPGRHRLTVDINAYSDVAGQLTGSNNGWTVSAKMNLTGGTAPHQVLAVVPLYLGVQTPGDTPPNLPFTVPPGAIGGRIEYRTSGHGQGPLGVGCVGPAEEFCNHPHQIFVDGEQVKTLRTWRNDCGTLCTVTHGANLDYCLENPCGDMRSVVAPRANWCPGSMTPPFVWDDISALRVPGPHAFTFNILSLLPGGSWQVSAIYFAYGS